MAETSRNGADTRRHFLTRTVVAACSGMALASETTGRPAAAATETDAPPMLKIISLLARKQGQTKEEFVEHWQRVHAPLVHAVPGVARYTLSVLTTSSTRADGVAPLDLKIDGIAELWFKDRASLEAAASSAAIKTVLADGTIFVGGEIDFIAEEKVIIPKSSY
jgi:uncharacterized protein (TIGR02118 family)